MNNVEKSHKLNFSNSFLSLSANFPLWENEWFAHFPTHHFPLCSPTKKVNPIKIIEAFFIHLFWIMRE
jgi:hypothetical protein